MLRIISQLHVYCHFSLTCHLHINKYIIVLIPVTKISRAGEAPVSQAKS